MGRTWAEAMAADLHGPGGFYRHGRGPGVDFRTAATVAPGPLADALVRLFDQLPAEVRREIVEIGAGDGSLLAALAQRLPDGVRVIGVEQRPRPVELPDRIDWRSELPDAITGLLLAFEWLDTVPVDVVVNGRLVEVAPNGTERCSRNPTARDSEWLDRWWPSGPRREVGHRRDDAWADAVARMHAGLAVAVDYGHLLTERPVGGTLAGYREGRQVPPVPGPHADVTAAVAWDAVLDAVASRGPRATTSMLLPQQKALRHLGITAALPGRAETDATTLRRANQARLLLDPKGLGGFDWAITTVGIELPELFAGLPFRSGRRSWSGRRS